MYMESIQEKPEIILNPIIPINSNIVSKTTAILNLDLNTFSNAFNIT